MKLIKIHNQLLGVILPLAIFPIIMIVIISSYNISNYLEIQNKEYYATILKQVANNIDFVYEQYARTLSNIFDNPDVIKFLELKEFKSLNHEKEIADNIVRDKIDDPSSVKNTVLEKIDGTLHIVDLEKKSLFYNTDYTIISVLSERIDFVKNLLEDPIFLKLKNDSSIKLIFGKTKKGTIPGIYSNNPVMIYPYYPKNNPNKSFTKFILVILTKGFINKFFNDIESLDYGTLYLIDNTGNMIASNHPKDNEYLDIDEKNRKFIRVYSDKQQKDSKDKMSFEEYKLLNVNEKILELDKIKYLLSNFDIENLNKYNLDEIKFENIKYICSLGYASISDIKLIFFYPVYYIKKPIYNILKIIIIISVFLIIIVIFLSYFLSKLFTRPIKILSDLTLNFSKGIYSEVPKINSSYEIINLANSFSLMINEIKNREEKLEEANKRLQNMDKIKSLFLFSLSHELRTPLNQIMVNVDFLINKIYDPFSEIGDLNRQIYNLVFNSSLSNKKEFLQLLLSFDKIFEQDNKNFFDIYYTLLYETNNNTLNSGEITNILNNMNDIYQNSIVKTNKSLKSIKEAGKNILSIIEIFSNISSMDASTQEIKFKEINLMNFINEIYDNLLNQINNNEKKKNLITLKKQIGYNLPEFIKIDEFKLKTVLLNIGNNAIKFSNSGDILIKVEKKDNNILFEISDHGIGIKEEDFGIIFQEFGRTEDAKNIEGLGLGLALSKRIVELLNGKIYFFSKYRVGSLFIVEIPYNN